MSPIGYSEHRDFPVNIDGATYRPAPGKSWKTDEIGIKRLAYAKRLLYYEDGERLRYLLRHSRLSYNANIDHMDGYFGSI